MTQPLIAGVVLVGGRSSRMGEPKAWLDWHGSTLARRTVGLLRRGVDGPLIVVAAPDQAVPPLPGDATVARDPAEGRGPLQGIAVGLAAAAAAGADRAFVCAVDMPLLHPIFVRRVVALAGGDDVAVPLVGGFRQPLAACYDVALHEQAARLAAEGSAGPGKLFAEVAVRWLEPTQLLEDRGLRDADPALESVTNANDPGSFAEVSRRTPPRVVVRSYGAAALTSRHGAEEVEVAGWSLGAVLTAAGAPLDEHVVVAIDGDHLTDDPTTPLAGGERISVLGADAGG